MPLQKCQKDGRPGYRWGRAGTCYPYRAGDRRSRERARRKALEQGKAIEAGR